LTVVAMSGILPLRPGLIPKGSDQPKAACFPKPAAFFFALGHRVLLDGLIRQRSEQISKNLRFFLVELRENLT